MKTLMTLVLSLFALNTFAEQTAAPVASHSQANIQQKSAAMNVASNDQDANARKKKKKKKTTQRANATSATSTN